MTRYNWNYLSVWFIISFILSGVLLTSFVFILILQFQFPGAGRCYTSYSDNEIITFADFDPSGNLYLAISSFSSFTEINSSYPYPTTLPPIPETANQDIVAIAKFSPDMNLLWARLLGTTSERGTTLHDLTFRVTEDGGLIISGKNSREPFLPDPDYSYGEGRNTFFILKLSGNGERSFFTVLKTNSIDYLHYPTDDGSNFIYVSTFFPPNGIPIVQHWNNTEPIGNEKAVVKIGEDGIVQWISYLPSDSKIQDLHFNGHSLGILVKENDWAFGSINLTNPWYFLSINPDLGSISEVQNAHIIGTPNSETFILTDDGDDFLVFQFSESYSDLLTINLTSNSVKVVHLFQIPIFPSIAKLQRTWDGILVSLEFQTLLEDSSIGEGISKISLNGNSTEYYLIALDSSGKKQGSIRILTEPTRSFLLGSFLDGDFLIATILTSAPFDLSGSFQSFPLGNDDPFLGLFNDNLAKGTFYGNVGNPSTVCLD
ncbi:MAG: hypothetical protein D6732_28385 [Methanobacteriota archaeon]|nr:MAG: hypothetical protein D6732_28385 [Euryarchaeota archaeon]